MKVWLYSHPARGTCPDPTCPSYGRCHDACGIDTKMCATTHTKRGYRMDQPYVFKSGHNPVTKTWRIGKGMKPTEAHTGTCNDSSCERHGWCHCGCGQQAAISMNSRSRNGYFIGMPRMYAHGHNPSTRKALVPGAFSKTLYPTAKIIPAMDYLEKVYGSKTEAAHALGWEYSMWWQLRHGEGVTEATLERLREAIKVCMTPRDPWTEYETRRVATPEDQAEAMRASREGRYRPKPTVKKGRVCPRCEVFRQPAELEHGRRQCRPCRAAKSRERRALQTVAA